MTTRKVRTIEIMGGYAEAGIHELTNHNDSPEIDKIQNFFGLTPGSANTEGSSYCLASLWWSRVKATCEESGNDPANLGDMRIAYNTLRKIHPVFFSCSMQIANAMGRGMWKPRAEYLAGRYKPSEGDWVYYQFAPGERHVEGVVSVSGSRMDTVGANVSPAFAIANNAKTRNGGFFRLNRPISGVILGWEVISP